MTFTVPTIEPTTTITVGEDVLQVADQSDEVKRMVTLFDQWRRRDAELTVQHQTLESEILCVRSALQHIQNTLLVTLTKAKDEAEVPADAVEAVAVDKPKRKASSKKS